MFCKNCGAEINEEAFCPNCGYKNGEGNVTSKKIIVVTNHPKSLSFILQAALCVTAIVLLFVGNYAWCYSKTPLTGAMTYYQSYWNFGDSSIWGMIAIFLLITPIAFSVLHFFTKKKAMTFVSMGCSISALLYMIFSSVYLSELFSSSDKIVKSQYFGAMRYEYDFLSFSTMYYVILGILVASIVISILDAINKPLLKSK